MSVFMFRFRRYRVLLLFSAFAIALWYHFSPTTETYGATDEWLQPSHDRGTTKEKLKSEWSAPDPDDAMPPAKGNPHGSGEDTLEVTPTPLSHFKPGQFSRPSTTSEPAAAETDAEVETETETEPAVPVREMIHDHVSSSRPPLFDEVLRGDFSGGDEETGTETPHWTKLPEHFPVPPESIIPLPTGNPKKLPKIQFDFKHGSESNVQRNERLMRQGAVKDAFKHAWEGYAKHAWGHDEVTPVSGSFKDPFAGWAATLVDALDTMAIMGLHTEFEHALTGVEKIDFTTTKRNEIPMFETTIRYLGGLIGAYDVTGHKHKILLDKAVELAEILYNAFDTPNRMPVLYFDWHPEEVKRKHRASRNACMAELGSLSVEFTRLAQITKENKYFDAIQRITDEFEKFLPNTTLPGFWPLTLDASGCEWIEESYTITKTVTPTPTPREHTEVPPALPSKKPADQNEQDLVDAAIKERINAKGSGQKFIHKSRPKVSDEDDQLDKEKSVSPTRKARKRTVESEDPNLGDEPAVSTKDKLSELRSGLAEMEEKAGESSKQGVIGVPPQKPDGNSDPDSLPKPTSKAAQPVVVKQEVLSREKCKPSGFRLNDGENKYSYGGMSDSTYEYLLKEHILLGGLKQQYGDLYVKTYETGRDNLFFRPMTPKNSDILVSGELHVHLDFPTRKRNAQLEGAGSHLTCFVGGMVGMGAKILDRPDDLETAIRLTEACVWNYFSTPTGIMPENFMMTQCPKQGSCDWDEMYWMASIIAPSEEAVFAAEKNHNIKLRTPFTPYKLYKRQVSYDGSGSKDVGAVREPPPPPLPDTEATASSDRDAAHGMRNGGHVFPDPQMDERPSSTTPEDAPKAPSGTRKKKDSYENWLEGVREHLKYARVPPGYSMIDNAKYILRPEAIESVFYMYRITGDRTWQDKGWKMFQAVERWTKTEIAHSAINSVLDTDYNIKLDSMESFWLAETLKYFYLLFSEPDVISLDDYVFNTEAHPLLRPKHVADA